MTSHETVYHDGFPVQQPTFAVPSDTVGLNPKSKRELTICNLFINHQLTVPDIIRVLDEDYAHVVKVLLNRGIVQERRQNRHVPPAGVDRRRSEN